MNKQPQGGTRSSADDPGKDDSLQGEELQGEGNYDATRRYDKAAREFVQSGKVDEAARAARPQSPEESEELNRAERIGQSHSKGEDPELSKPSTTPKKK